MEVRYHELDRARNIFERYVQCLPTVKAYVRYAKFEMQNGDIPRARACYERAVEQLGDDAQTVSFSWPKSRHRSAVSIMGRRSLGCEAFRGLRRICICLFTWHKTAVQHCGSETETVSSGSQCWQVRAVRLLEPDSAPMMRARHVHALVKRAVSAAEQLGCCHQAKLSHQLV